MAWRLLIWLRSLGVGSADVGMAPKKRWIGLGLLAVAGGCGAKIDYATIPGSALYQVRCVACHGLDGRGDGPASASLQPKPRAFSDAAWQDSVTDHHLAKVIVGGGLAVGKSGAMPPQSDLGEHPEALQKLIEHLRGLKSAPTAPK